MGLSLDWQGGGSFVYCELAKLNQNYVDAIEKASELKDDFSEEHCISANDNQDVENKQIMLNSLEDKTNPYRAVFAVDELNEGWDVLNLFDIVRLYETRDGKNGIPGKTTMKEAQLIGRGARYCPFKITEEQEKYISNTSFEIN